METRDSGTLQVRKYNPGDHDPVGCRWDTSDNVSHHQDQDAVDTKNCNECFVTKIPKF
jgi:hypothetical protein